MLFFWRGYIVRREERASRCCSFGDPLGKHAKENEMVLTRTCTWGVLLGLAALPGLALANPEVIKLSQDAKNWAMQAGNMPNHRSRSLKQISTGKVKDLAAPWTFFAGALGGPRGG